MGVTGRPPSFDSPPVSRPAAVRFGRYPALDGFRGVAIALVVVAHAFPGDLPGGIMGVDLFFVLSGFLITGLLLEELDDHGSIATRAFYLRRARRLFPALGVLVVLALVLTAITGSNLNPAMTPLRITVPLVLLYVGNWWVGITQQGLGWFAHTWSLAIEEQFYLVWPFVVGSLLWRARRPPLWLSAAILAIAVARGVTFALTGFHPIEDWTFFRADALLLGALAEFVRRRGAWVGVSKAGLWPAVVVVAAVTASVHSQSDWLQRGGYTVFAFAAAVIVLAVSSDSSGRLGTALSWGPLRGLGKVSYGVYLYHFPIFTLTERYIISTAPRLVVEVSVTAVAVGASWVFVERPFLRPRASRANPVGPPALTSLSHSHHKRCVDVDAPTGVR